MVFGILHDKKQRNDHSNERKKYFPDAGIEFPVGRFVFPVRPDLGCNEKHHEENNEGNLAGGEFHVEAKGNARLMKSYF